MCTLPKHLRFNVLTIIFNFANATISGYFTQTVWWNRHRALPEREEIWDVLQLSEAELEKPENSVKKELFLWYYDQWLPAVLPREFWKEDIRYYKLLTDTIELAGKQKVLVTVSSEAFGLLMWENCREKWINFCVFKEQNGEKAPLPVGKEAGAELHLAKWSDGSAGQVKYGGWKEEAYVRLEALKKEVKEWRKTDNESGKLGQKLAFKLMRAAHNKRGKTPLEDKKKSSRNRGARKAVQAAPAKRRKLTVEDE